MHPSAARRAARDYPLYPPICSFWNLGTALDSGQTSLLRTLRDEATTAEYGQLMKPPRHPAVDAAPAAPEAAPRSRPNAVCEARQFSGEMAWQRLAAELERGHGSFARGLRLAPEDQRRVPASLQACPSATPRPRVSRRGPGTCSFPMRANDQGRAHCRGRGAAHQRPPSGTARALRALSGRPDDIPCLGSIQTIVGINIIYFERLVIVPK